MNTPTSNGLDTGDGFFGFLDESQHLKVMQDRDVSQSGGFWSDTGTTDYDLNLNLPGDLASYPDQARAGKKLRPGKRTRTRSPITVPRGRAEGTHEGRLSYEFETSPARMLLAAPTHISERRDETTDPPPAYTEATVPSHRTPQALNQESRAHEVFSSRDIEPHSAVPEHQPVPNAVDNAEFIRDHFFPTANVSIDERATATTVMNEFGGITVTFSTPGVDSASSQLDWTHEPTHGVHDLIGQANQSAQRSSQSGEVCERQNSTQATYPGIYIDGAGTLTITGGTFVAQTAHSYRRY